MKHSQVIAVFLMFAVTGCGANWQKPMTKDEMMQYPTAIAFSKERYTNIRASLGTSKWQQRETADRNIAAFIIGSNPTMFSASFKAFMTDESGYCEARGGVFKDISRENNAKRAELSNKYSYQEESRNFECGPAGRGTISRDWTKFNPAVCRKLYETKVDMVKVNAEYGKPADIQCALNNGVLFMGTIGSESYQTSMGPGKNMIIRLNEAKTGIIMQSSSGRIDME